MSVADFYLELGKSKRVYRRLVRYSSSSGHVLSSQKQTKIRSSFLNPAATSNNLIKKSSSQLNGKDGFTLLVVVFRLS